jgi:hypothetical protein
MPPPDEPPSFPPSIDWGGVYVQALSLARLSVRPQDVTDLVGEGMKRVMGGEAPWEEARNRTLPEHVVAVGYNAMREQWRKASQPRDAAVASKLRVAVEEDAKWTPEDSVAEAEHIQRKAHLFERLVEACAGDPEALAVLEHEQLGVHEPAEQARRAGLTIEAIRNARKRIKRRALELVDAEREPEGGA